MATQPIAYYKKKIAEAQTKEELRQISYLALRDDDECMVFSRKMERIDALCLLREAELGLLPNDPEMIATYRKVAKTGKMPL